MHNIQVLELIFVLNVGAVIVLGWTIWKEPSRVSCAILLLNVVVAVLSGISLL